MTDPDLRLATDACKSILAKLSQISDAPTAQLRQGPRPPHYADTRIPDGVRTKADLTKQSHAPSKQFSLWGHYTWRMQRALERKDAAELLKLAACATRDYEIYRGKRTISHANHETAVIQLLRDCTGMPAIEASWWLDAPLKWVRRHRVLNGRDAEFGEVTKQSPRTTRVLELKRGGATVRTIAMEVGLSPTQVQRIVSGAA